MIIGLGTDIAENERIESLLKKYNNRFLKRIFTTEEIEYCMKKKNPAPHLAARFSVKEAFIKSLGLRRDLSLSYNEVGLEGTTGKKSIVIKGKLKELIDQKNVDSIHFSISHAENYSSAVVVLEKNG